LCIWLAKKGAGTGDKERARAWWNYTKLPKPQDVEVCAGYASKFRSKYMQAPEVAQSTEDNSASNEVESTSGKRKRDKKFDWAFEHSDTTEVLLRMNV
jgi:hypothetical protein